MKTALMMTVLLLSFGNLCVAELGSYFQGKEKEVANKALTQIEKEMQTLEGFASVSNTVIGEIIKKAVLALKIKGSWRLALEIEKGWQENKETLLRLVQNQQSHLSIRAIGDFEPFNQWLSETYEKIEADLGYQYCHSQRLSDLKTINHGLVVTFKPCDYGYDEFFKHFASKDPKYRSLLPVVSYWGTVIGCYAGTYGTGAIMVCGAAGLIVENLVEQQLAPALAPQIYAAACP